MRSPRCNHYPGQTTCSWCSASMLATDASRRLRAAGASVEWADTALIASAGRGFKLRRELAYADGLGSLVNAAEVESAEREFLRKLQQTA